MPKKLVNITIKNGEESNKITVNAIVEDEKIKYLEKDNTIVVFKYKDNILIRENNDLRMEYIFKERQETEGILLIKEYNKEMSIKIYTEKIIKNDENLEVEFNIENNKFIYNIEVLK